MSFVFNCSPLTKAIILYSKRKVNKKLKEILNDNFKKEILSGIIHDIDSKKRLIYTSNIRVSYDFSEKYLEKIGFSWKNIDREYILKYMNYFKGIGFIEY